MIIVKKTYEIDDELWEEIAAGFREAFGRETTADSLKTGFCVRNQWGYAYHAIDYDDETHEIRGFNTYTPTLYKNNVKILVSGSTFVKEKYRKDIFVYFDMAKELKKKGHEEGFVMSVGVPNQNSFKYSIKFLKATFVGYLDYYILPRNVSRCFNKPVLKPFDWLSRSWSWLHLNGQLAVSKMWNTEEEESKYEFVTDDEYYKVRFGDECYLKYTDGIFRAYYRMVDENGAQTAYLLDFRENGKRTKRALAKAALYIVKHSHPDAILFVGFLKLSQHVLLKVPTRFVPKPLPMTCSIIDKKDKEKFADMAKKENWNFSLMNFDVR